MEEAAMPRVRFIEDFDYTPSAQPRATVAYKAAMELPVKQECADLAIAAGKAQLVEARASSGRTPKAATEAQAKNDPAP